MYIRVKDPSTKHEFDLPEEHSWIASGEVTPVKSDRYPPSPQERPAKFHLDPPTAGSGKASSTEAPKADKE